MPFRIERNGKPHVDMRVQAFTVSQISLCRAAVWTIFGEIPACSSRVMNSCRRLRRLAQRPAWLQSLTVCFRMV